MSFLNSSFPSVPFGVVYERVSKKGRKYLTGRLGHAKLMIVMTDELSRGEVVWQLFLSQGPYATEEQAELAAEVEGKVSASTNQERNTHG